MLLIEGAKSVLKVVDKKTDPTQLMVTKPMRKEA